MRQKLIDLAGLVENILIEDQLRVQTRDKQASYAAAQEDFLQQVLNTSMAAITVLDEEGLIVYASPTAEQILGLSAGSQEGAPFNSPPWKVRSVDGGPFPDVELPFTRLRGGEGRVRDVQHSIVWPDGHWRVLSINGAEVSENFMNRGRYVLSITDITEQYRYRHAIESNNQALNLLNDIAFKLEGSLDEQIQEALKCGREFLGLDIGIVSEVVEESYTIRWCDYSGDFNLTPGQQLVLGKTYCEMVVHGDGEMAIEHMRESEYHGHPCYSEFGLEAYLGRALYVDDRLFGTLNFSSPLPRPAFNDSERLFVRLLTRWIESKIEQHQAQKKLDKLMEQVPGAIFQFRLWSDGRMAFPFMTGGVNSLYGITPEEAMADAQLLFQRTHPEDLPSVEDSIQASARSLSDWTSEYRAKDSHGSYRWLRGNSRPELLPDNSVLWHGYITDIHDHKQAELALESSESRLRGLFQLSPIGIALNDDETGQFLEVNQAMLEPTGYTREELLKCSPADLTATEYRDLDSSARAEFYSKGRYGPIEKEYVRKDGTRYPVRVSGLMTTDSSGRKVVWKLIEDITERRKLDQLKNQFISTVSHELRTPLTSLNGALRLVASHKLGTLPEKAHHMLNLAQRNSERLGELINDLLDMEQLVAGRMEFKLARQPLQPIVQESIEVNAQFGGQRSVAIRLAEESPDAEVSVDRPRLVQAISNLLSNAVKFSPEQGIVEVSLIQRASDIDIEVRDYGPGVPDSFHEKLFDRFAQADTSDTRRIPGTGLGLSITKELMEHMNGEVGCARGMKQGALFWLRLPLSLPGSQEVLQKHV